MKENEYRTILVCDLDSTFTGKEIIVSGWVKSIRDHGGVLFLDLRDTSGVLQTVSNNDNMFEKLTRESVVRLKGIIRKRSIETYNNSIKTGEIELLVNDLKVLSSSVNELPFEILSSRSISEDIRLKYRYLDMRNDKVKDNILLRSEVLHYLRNKMHDMSFTEVQTPILTASSPEGARDFVVPSRKNNGKFYALPQAPQIYKELLMVGGISKYYQIAPCFRDEDSRKDRTMEFYQLDIEMSFVNEEDVLSIGEKIFYDVFSKYSDKKVSLAPFKRLSYSESMEKYGTDKPDLRNPLIIKDISNILKNTTFKPFNNTYVKSIKVDSIGDKPNSWFNEIVDYAKSIGMPGIGYLTLLNNEFKGPIDKFLTIEERDELIKYLDVKDNSVIFFIANKDLKVCQKFSGNIRTYLGEKLSLIDKNIIEFCIVKDFPLFEYDNDKNKIEFCHNPFSMPKSEIMSYNKDELLNINAYQYDFVCNGNEMASGAIRNNDLDSLMKNFEIVGYSKEEIENRFRSLFTAFKYGCPPHGGMALGIDRILMIIKDEDNLREVQAFPTSSSGIDLMMGSPSTINEEQLKELGIRFKEEL